MVTVPGFLLRRLYVKGSLRNNDNGFEFQLKNVLGSGYARRLFPLTIDGKELPMEQTLFIVEGREISFDQVSEAVPLTLAMNKVTSIFCRGHKLEKGPHKIGMRFAVKGLGELGFDFTDSIKE